MFTFAQHSTELFLDDLIYSIKIEVRGCTKIYPRPVIILSIILLTLGILPCLYIKCAICRMENGNNKNVIALRRARQQKRPWCIPALLRGAPRLPTPSCEVCLHQQPRGDYEAGLFSESSAVLFSVWSVQMCLQAKQWQMFGTLTHVGSVFLPLENSKIDVPAVIDATWTLQCTIIHPVCKLQSSVCSSHTVSRVAGTILHVKCF